MTWCRCFLKLIFTDNAVGEGSANGEQMKSAIAITSAVPKCGVTKALMAEFNFPKWEQLRLPLLETV
jgi:hypothetical protein